MAPVKNGCMAFEMAKKTNLWKFKLSPGVPYLQILVVLGHDCYIESVYGSWTTQIYNKLSKQTTRAKVTRGCRW